MLCNSNKDVPCNSNNKDKITSKWDSDYSIFSRINDSFMFLDPAIGLVLLIAPILFVLLLILLLFKAIFMI